MKVAKGMRVSVLWEDEDGEDKGFYEAIVERIEKDADGEEWVTVRWPVSGDYPPTHRVHIDDIRPWK